MMNKVKELGAIISELQYKEEKLRENNEVQYRSYLKDM